jgi:uncharacterized protein (DUF342 family)
MKETIANGKSLESIRQKWAAVWDCAPDQLILDVLEKPGVFNRSWKVKITLKDPNASEPGSEKTQVKQDGNKYIIIPGSITETIVPPFSSFGKLLGGGQEITQEQPVQKGDLFEFYPATKAGTLSWTIEIAEDGSKATALVKHERSGSYKLEAEIPALPKLELEQFVLWDPTPDSEQLRSEKELSKELGEKGITYGLKPKLWEEFLKVNGEKEIVVAEYTPPVPSVQPQIIDYVGETDFQFSEDETKIDYFACKLKVCQKDEVLARKVPGKEGTPGTNIFGKTIPVEHYKDFGFNLKKNVYLSEDGLEVKAACAGTPLRVNNATYLVENAFILNKDIDLETGSINFPGDVIIGRDVKDGLFIYSGGKIKIHGSVSGADLKAEAGLVVNNNIIASTIVVGERHVLRSQLVKGLNEVNEDLNLCIAQVEQLQNASGNTNVGQLLKILLEKNFTHLPKNAEKMDSFLDLEDPDFISPELKVAIKTVSRFLVGMGPLQMKNLVYLKNAIKIIGYFLSTKGELVPANVTCDTNYVQNSDISCAGDFLCKKGIYNSTVKVEGNIKIMGVCRGGEISCSGNIYIWELGGSGISSTTIRAGKNSRISVEYSHPNIRIYVGKELVRIDEGVQKLDIYREKGLLQIEKLKWDGKN